MPRKVPRFKKTKEQRRQDRNRKLISIALAAIFVISLAGVFLGTQQAQGTQKFEYGDYRFELVAVEGQAYLVFQTTINNQEVYFYTLPQETERLTVHGDLGQLFETNDFFILSTDDQPEYRPYFDELRFVLDRYAGKQVAPAQLGGNENSTLQMASCADATAQIPVIEVIFGNQTEIVAINSCVQIVIRDVDRLLLRDRLLYESLGVMN